MITAKSRLTYVLLALFLGCLGIHNFYAGYTEKAILQLLVTLLLGWLLFPLIAVAMWSIAEAIVVETDASGAMMRK